ncbi:hypothetical protein Csa_004580 [Cucumis sativus]|nr:hypothetical protein Csa_004580 [Cucumis sativus]
MILGGLFGKQCCWCSEGDDLEGNRRTAMATGNRERTEEGCGERRELTLWSSQSMMVQDLHSITPDYFLEVGGAVIHPLSYQQARNFRFKCGLVYVTEPGYVYSDLMLVLMLFLVEYSLLVTAMCSLDYY